jgi:hypothetical protein
MFCSDEPEDLHDGRNDKGNPDMDISDDSTDYYSSHSGDLGIVDVVLW